MGTDATPAAVEAWEEHYDEQRKKAYYYNTVTKESQWEHPKVSIKKQPSPPPKPKQELREADQWSKIDDGKGKGKMVWYNIVTEAKQYALPACRMKYRP